MIKIFNCVALICMVAVNIWAAVFEINQNSTGEVSSLYPTLYAPADFTFSIWYVIYLGLAAFCVQQFKAPKEYSKAMGILFIISCILNIAWLFAWHHLLMGLSTLLMAGLLVVLIIIYRRIKLVDLQKEEKWALCVPFSLYLGWLSVAFISNVAVALNAYGFDKLPELLTVLMITASFILAVVVTQIENDMFFAMAIFWALIGILSKYWLEPAYENIVITAAVGIILITVTTMVKRPKYFRNN